MATPENKLKAISDIVYPSTLGDLQHYLGLTGYLRQHVPFYAQLARPPQDLKTLLLLALDEANGLLDEIVKIGVAMDTIDHDALRRLTEITFVLQSHTCEEI